MADWQPLNLIKFSEEYKTAGVDTIFRAGTVVWTKTPGLYRLAKDVHVVIRIYDASGLPIRTLDLGQQAAGVYTTKARAAYWNGRNDHGEPVGSGVYFYTIQAGEFSATRKMVILK